MLLSVNSTNYSVYASAVSYTAIISHVSLTGYALVYSHIQVGLHIYTYMYIRIYTCLCLPKRYRQRKRGALQVHEVCVMISGFS